MAENTPKRRPRADNVLDTGMTSAATRRQEERLKRQRELRENRRAQLTPGAEIIVQWIDQEIAEAKDLTKMIINIDTEDNVRAQLLAKQYHVDFLLKLKSKTKNILREVKQAEAKAEAEKSEAQKAWEAEAKTS